MASTRSLFFYWKILGVCPFNVVEDGMVRVSYIGSIYGLIMAMAYTYYYLRAVTSGMTFVLPHKTPMSVIANFSALSVEYVSLVSAWLYFGLRPKQLGKIFIRLRSINDSFANNGIPTDDINFFGKLKIQAIALNIMWYFICGIAYNLFLHFEPFKLSVWMPLMIPRVASHNIMLMFVNSMTLINHLFRSFNEMIMKVPYKETNVIDCRKKEEETPIIGAFDLFADNTLSNLGQLHANLLDLATMVVEFFSLSLLLTILFGIFQMASGFYTLCVIAQDRALISWAYVWIYWVAIHVVELNILTFVCESTVREANRTGSVLHRMLTSGGTEKYVDSAKVFSLQLLQKQFRVKVYGLFEIKYATVNRIASMVIVYITIMMQLDSQNAESTRQNIN